MLKKLLLIVLCYSSTLSAQDYFLKKYHPFNSKIPSPEEFLGYAIGERHTRHDLIVSYLTKLAEVSDRASIYEYGKTHEGRKLIMLTVSAPENIKNIDILKEQHLAFTKPSVTPTNYNAVSYTHLTLPTICSV